MKAVVMTEPGEAPSYGEFADPEPAEGEQVSTLVGAGLHQIVRSRAAGRHYSSGGDWPRVPGVDAVARRGDGSVIYTGRIDEPWGTMAERMASRIAIEVPAGADPLAVAAGVNPAMSGWIPLRQRTDEIVALGTVVVPGATGLSGRLAVAGALDLGAEHVIAIGRNSEALERMAGPQVSTVLLDADREQVVTAIVGALDGRAASLVLDYVWGDVATTVLEALAHAPQADDAPSISYVQIGSMAGATTELSAVPLRSRRIVISGSGLGSIDPARMYALMPEVIERLADGRFTVPYRPFGLSEVAEAWSYTGRERVVLVPDAG